MLEGIAVGGPRNGVRLMAPATWNGQIRLPEPKAMVAESGSRMYPGRYIFDDVAGTWIWHEIPEERTKWNRHRY